MKMIQHPFQSIIHQTLKWRTSIYLLMASVFDVPIKNIEETYKKIIETGKDNIIQLIIDLTIIIFQSITN